VKRMNEVPWRRWVEFIEELVRSSPAGGPRWAVFCTFDFRPDRFISDVLPLLQGRGRAFRVLVLMDASRFQTLPPSALYRGARYNLHPVRLSSGGYRVFHPKLAFLRAGDRVRVGWGSANLTDGGMGGNLELWATTEDRELCAAATDFLARLGGQAAVGDSGLLIDPGARRALGRATCGIPSKPSPRFWTSLDRSFAQQLERADAGLKRAKQVRVVSPAYATPGGLKAVAGLFERRFERLYTDAVVGLDHARLRLYRGGTTTASGAHATEDDEGGLQRQPTRLHAKAYLFSHPRGAALWTGSANFTKQALLRAAAKGGNVELLVRADLDPTSEAAWVRELENPSFFSSPTKHDRLAALEPAPENESAARGIILSAEWVETGGQGKLLFHASEDARSATVLIAGRQYKLRFEHGRAELSNITLLTELGRNGSAWTTCVSECVGKDRVPIIVNVPLVSERLAGTGALERLIDERLDELLARTPPLLVSSQKEGDLAEEMDAELADEELEQAQRRLDEANHQGLLDRVAVKVAMLRRYAGRSDHSKALLESFIAELGTIIGPEDQHIARFIVSILRTPRRAST